MTVDGSFLYSSKLEGVIELWDLDTKQKLRVIKAHKGDVMTLQMGWGYLWSAGSNGFARVSRFTYTLLAFLLTAPLNRNTARSNMANTRILQHSARSITACTDGRLTRAEYWRQQSPPTKDNSFTLLVPMTTRYRFGTSLVVFQMNQRERWKCMKTSWSSHCKNLYHSRQSLLDQIMQRTVEEEQHSCGHCSKSMAHKQRC